MWKLFINIKLLESELKLKETHATELESAIKILDQSILEKQDTITRLREQLDQVKCINLDLVEKFKVN